MGTRSPHYKCWENMIQRSTQRGTPVDDRWRTFRGFVAHAASGDVDGMRRWIGDF